MADSKTAKRRQQEDEILYSNSHTYLILEKYTSAIAKHSRARNSKVAREELPSPKQRSIERDDSQNIIVKFPSFNLNGETKSTELKSTQAEPVNVVNHQLAEEIQQNSMQNSMKNSLANQTIHVSGHLLASLFHLEIKFVPKNNSN